MTQPTTQPVEPTGGSVGLTDDQLSKMQYQVIIPPMTKWVITGLVVIIISLLGAWGAYIGAQIVALSTGQGDMRAELAVQKNREEQTRSDVTEIRLDIRSIRDELGKMQREHLTHAKMVPKKVEKTPQYYGYPAGKKEGN